MRYATAITPSIPMMPTLTKAKHGKTTLHT
jgi:hypothetical protein